MLTATNLSCERDERILFHSLSFEVSAGEVLHIRGANGSGKTSLLRILLGLAQADAGEVHWQTQSIRQMSYRYQHSCCYIGHQPAIKACLTPRELLSYYGFDDNKIAIALGEMGLVGYEDCQCRTLSAGQQRRVALSRLLLSTQPLWILDEPFTALDQTAVSQLQSLISKHAEQGGMTILSSHQPFTLVNTRIKELLLDNEILLQ